MDGQFQNTQNTSGLLRFRSAPVSLFANFTDLVSDKDGVNNNINNNNNCEATIGLSSRFNLGGGAPGSLKDDDNKGVINGGMNSHSQLPPQYPRQSGGASAAQLGSLDGGYRVVASMGMEMGHHGQPKIGSNLMRQNSSPAGLFSHLTSQNDYATTRGPGSYRVVNGSTGDLGPASTRFKDQMSYPSSLSSSVGFLSRISEVENENGTATGADSDKLGNENREAQLYSSVYPFGSWHDPSNFVESLTGLKREEDSNVKSFVNSQTGDLRNRPPILSHQLSLPNTSAEMAAMDKMLHFQDSVPCKIRAKRGCATHPRSIAERVRRTRISERMRKLQELVPNMDKQTNTADMLDLAVEYIKDLQNQYKTLTDMRAKCKCTVMQKPVHTSSYM